MCGIAGIIDPAERPDHLDSLINAMLDSLVHRGPDGKGVFTDRPAGFVLGHRRLAILDLSEAGKQPMRSHDGRFVMALNGEIFNYRELRKEIEGPWRSATDTEIFLEACSCWGVDQAVERANGMFAFALWDCHRRELTLGRDRLGEKPLVYFTDGRRFGFASEMKALIPIAGTRLDPQAVDSYLALGYVPAPQAIFRDCRKLAAGHLLQLRGGNTQIRRYWRPERIESRPGPDKAEELRARIGSAVKIRLRSDVPVALSLSGGVDSSVIAAECVERGANLEAFTVAFEGDSADLPYAHLAAARLGLRHTFVEAGTPGAATLFDHAIAHYDEPFADSSALPSLALGRALEGRYKVILTGDGGDEAFAGYRHYESIGAKQRMKALAAAAGILDGAGADATGVYVESKVIFRTRDRERMLEQTPDGLRGVGTLRALLEADPYLRHGAIRPPLARALWSDRHLYLANDLTYKTDIALSAASIEGRAPFLDHTVLEWAQTLRPSDLVRGREKKVLLRKAYRGVLPDEILDRPKHGFGAPILEWLGGPLAAILKETLPTPLLDRSAQRGASRSPEKLWSLLCFARWAQKWRAAW